jgi:hypothetical protein
MSIKWNWGTKLTLFILLFMGFIFVLVYLSTQNSIILVEKDYYPKGLKFQDRIDERSNAHFLKDGFELNQEEEFVVLSLPEIHPDTGTVVFYRYNDNLLDLTIPINPDTLWTMRFPVSSFKKGKYLLKVHWFEKEKGYYVEKPFFFE